MSDREDIKRRVEDFRKFQERLCAERDARMDAGARRIRESLSETRAEEENGRKTYYWPTPTL
jgi:hypothetical protein